ncbi:MAG: dTDP-4-dehydrorhamnose 3,5-epimerase [Hyphomicrobiales bacterium]|nr:dTDP-4-dehydrorhamnose 3,5-epimerase [Hyphomicrobiales bacterium]
MTFEATRLSISDVMLIRSRRFTDARGYFAETYRRSYFDEIGVRADFVQDNQALSVRANTIRGLHFQNDPHAQAKLVRVLTGAILDVAVDLRSGSETYGQWVGAKLTADGGEQLFIPRGFAHGYCTLEAQTVIAYKCDNYYAAEAEGGVHHADRDIGIAWPPDVADPIVSEKDDRLPGLGEIVAPFVCESAP